LTCLIEKEGKLTVLVIGWRAPAVNLLKDEGSMKVVGRDILRYR
jgi:hypothetical protein